MIAAAPRPTSAAQSKFADTARRLRYFSSAEYLYRAVLSDAERERLLESPPAPAEGNYGVCVRIWQALYGGSDLHALLNAARATGCLSEADRRWLLREYDVEEDPLAGFTVTFPADTLVIRLWPRTAYWNRELIDVRWADHGTSWDYLWQLADRSRMGVFLESRDMSRDSQDPKYLSKLKSRLKKTPGFPASLISKIDDDSRRHRLKLSRDQIRIYSRDCGLLVEAS